jgi:O-antigen/teichoic acid export membrane protein
MAPAGLRARLAVSLAGYLGHKLLSYAVLALLARLLAPDEFGVWLFALALGAVLLPLTDGGLSDHLTRTAAASPAGALDEAGRVLTLRLPLLAAFTLAAAAAPTPAGVTTPVFAAAAAHLALLEVWRTQAALFAGLHRFAWPLVGFGLHLAVLLASLPVATRLAPGLGPVAACHLLSAAVAVAFGVAAQRRLGRVRLGSRGDAPAWHALGRSWRLFLLALVAVANLKLGTLLLGAFADYREVARYETSARLLEASQFLMRPAMLVLFPWCAGLAAAGSAAELRRILPRAAAAALGLGAAVSAVAITGAPSILAVVYGEPYAASAEVMRTLFLGLPALYLATVASLAAMSLNAEGPAVLAMLVGLAVNAALGLLLIPAAGAAGAAAAAALAQGVAALGLAAVCWRGLGSLQAAAAARP